MGRRVSPVAEPKSALTPDPSPSGGVGVHLSWAGGSSPPCPLSHRPPIRRGEGGSHRWPCCGDGRGRPSPGGREGGGRGDGGEGPGRRKGSVASSEPSAHPGGGKPLPYFGFTPALGRGCGTGPDGKRREM